MKINQQKKFNILKVIFGVLLLAVLNCLTNSTQAQTKTSGRAETNSNRVQIGEGCEKLLREATTLYFPMKALAEDLYNAHLRQGDCAKLWFDSKRNEWALAIKAVPNAKARGGAIKTPVNTVDAKSSKSAQTAGEVKIGANCEQLLKTATILHFPTKQMAEDLYNAHLRQGDCAKLSYDAKRKEWELAIKAVPGASARRGTATTSAKTTAASNKTTAATGKNATAATVSADGEKLPKGASVIYFPTRETAEGIYKASLKQGDWAKMWFDKKRGEWAVAVKSK